MYENEGGGNTQNSGPASTENKPEEARDSAVEPVEPFESKAALPACPETNAAAPVPSKAPVPSQNSSHAAEVPIPRQTIMAAAVPLPRPPQLLERRTFLRWGIIAWGIFFTWLAGIFHLLFRFMFPNVLYERDPRFIAGKKFNFPESPKVYEYFKQSHAVWLVRLQEEGEDRLVAISTTCTHLGCTPNWLVFENKFKCPCHGSGFYFDGVNFEGPAPRPLERYRIYLDGAANIIVDKSIKYRRELGQWSMPGSFVAMS